MFPKDDTVLLAMYGATAGKASLLRIDACTNQAICAIMPDKTIADPLYLKYKLDTMYDYLVRLSSGSARDNLSQAGIANLEISFPSLPEQKRIASILSALDRKIALNKQINQNLEALARQLYDYWFVQFDFPNAEGKPYKSSGGKMTYNPILKREIPEGWEVKKIGEVLDVISEKISPKQLNEKDRYTPIEVIPRREMSFSESVPLESATSGLCRYNRGDILLSNRRVYFHKVCIASFDGITRDTVIIMRPKNLKNLGYLFQIVFSEHYIKYATLNSYGSEQPVLSSVDAMKYLAVFPNNNLDLLYSEKVCSIIEKIIANHTEIESLTRQRDELLPLLMNGQVSVE